MSLPKIAMIVRQNVFSLQFYKYVLLGVLNALLTIFIFYLFLKVFSMHYIVAFTISWLVGVLFTYVINFMFIFRPDEKLEFKKRLPKYFVVYLTSFLLNIVLLKLLVFWTHGDPFYLQFLILPLVIAINFTGFKYWALK